MAKKVERTRCDNKWSEAKYKSFITSVLRRASGRWSPKHTVIKNSRVARGKYLCGECQAIVGPKQIRADHIEPVVPVTGFTTWDSFINRLFVEKEGLRAICKDCHSIKTKEENRQRKQLKKLT